MPAYRLPSPYDRPPLRRRASGLALAIGINLLLFLALLGISRFAPVVQKASRAIVVDMLPESQRTEQQPANKPIRRERSPMPPPIVLPVKPTIAPPPPPEPDKSSPWIEMSKADMAAGEISSLPKAARSAEGDSKEVGRGPHGEVLYAAEWARVPSDAELGGYLPRNAPDGWGLIACRTIPNNRVEDCIELGQSPAGSHLASALRQAAWQFRVRPPRRNGRPLVGEWVSIRIDYEHIVSGGAQ